MGQISLAKWDREKSSSENCKRVNGTGARPPVLPGNSIEGANMNEDRDQTSSKTGEISRRRFVGGLAASAGFMVVPRHVLGGPGYKAPSDTLNIATVGCGGMGNSNTVQCVDENVVALCDVDDALGERTYRKFPDAKTYRDYRVMLEKQKDIDAVIIATPDHSHAVIALACMELGKHVYVQKPMTRTIWEARMLTEAARRYKVVSQMGNQGHSGEGVRLIQEWIADGAIGQVAEVHCWTNRPIWPQGMPRPVDTPKVPSTLDWDFWVGPAPMRPYHPAYHPFSWRSWMDFGCGALGDMACHVMDASYTALHLGSPTSVTAYIAFQVIETPKVNQEGELVPNRHRVEYNDSYPMSTIVHYSFPARGDEPPVKLHWYDGGLLPERPEELEPDHKMPESGTMFVGEKGKLLSETYSESPRLIPDARMREYKRPEKTIPRIKGTHEQNWIEACKSNGQASSHFDYAGPFTETVLLGNLAIRFPGQKLAWDASAMSVTNLAAANEFIKPVYREGWGVGNHSAQ
jgi:predicted dehydrogenase